MIKTIYKTWYNLFLIGLWVIFLIQFLKQIVLSIITFLGGNITGSFLFMLIAVIIVAICGIIAKFMIDMK